MKKFFTLCLMFFAVGVLNLSAGYVLSGENVNGEAWNHSSATNTFTADENGDLVLKGVSLSGEFLVTKDQSSWYKPIYGAQLTAGVPVIMTTDNSDNCKCATSYTNCTIKLTEISNAAVAIEIISTDTADVEITSIGESWGLIGDFNSWASDISLTKKEYGVYEAWLDQATVESIISGGFKFRADAAWNADFGATDLSYNFNEWNILFRGSSTNIQMTQPAETYDKYLLTLCVEGSSAKFRIDGYNEAVLPTTVFYESFTGSTGTGPDDGAFNGNAGNGTLTTDNEGWTAEKKYGANNAAKFGTGSVVGVVTTPALGLTGDATLTFKAAPWNSETGLTLSISGGTLSQTDCTMTAGEWTEYTIKITGATADATLTFTPAQRFFLDEVKVIQGEATESAFSAAEITMTEGVVKDGSTVYFNRNMTYPAYKVAFPEGAAGMNIEVLKDGQAYQTFAAQTADYTVQLTEAGVFTINVTVYGDGAYTTSSKEVTVEALESYYSIDEFISAGVAGTAQAGYMVFSPVVVNHTGKYLFIRCDNQGGLIYASLDKTYNKGDVLAGFPASYGAFKGTNQMVPLVSSLGDPYSTADVTPTEVTAENWAAYATADNQNEYVLVKGVAYSATDATLGGVAIYNDRFNIELPTADGNYDVELIMGVYNGTVQVYPLSFTESDPNSYNFEIVPDIAEGNVTELSTIIFKAKNSTEMIFPTTEAQAANWVIVKDANGNIYNTTAKAGKGYDVTIEGVTEPGTYTVTIPKASVYDMMAYMTDKTKYNYNDEVTFTYTVVAPAVTYDWNPVSITPANGAEVTSLEKVTFTMGETSYYDLYGVVTVADQDGNTYNAYFDDYTWAETYHDLIIEGVTNPGTYTVTVKEGTFFDEEYNNTLSKGRVNEAITLTYTVKAPALEVASVTPENGTTVACLKTVTLTFAESVTENAEAGEITCVGTVKDPDYNKADVTVSVDGATVTFALAETSDYWYAGETYQLTIPAGYFTGTSGKTNEALTYSWTISEEASYTLTPVTVEPASGNTVESLSEIYLTFDEPVKNYYSAGKASLKDADGNEVATGSYSRYDATGTFNKYMIKVTLSAAVSAAGEYTLTIPQGALGDYTADYYYYNKGCVNPELTYNYTIGVAGPEEGFSYESITPDPEETASLSSIESVVVTFPADVTYDGSLVMIGTTAMTAMGTLTVTVEGNTVTFTPSAPITAVGDHQLTWNAGAFTAANGAKCAKATINYTVAEADPNKYDYVLTADPADGSTLTALTSITLSDATGSGLPYLTTEAKDTQNWVVVSDADGNIYSATLANTTGITITVEGATAPGTYTVFIPEKTYYDVMYSMTSPYRYNPEMTLTYTVEEADPYTYTYGISAIDPAEGVVESLGNQVFFTVTGDWIEFSGSAYTTPNWVVLTDQSGKIYNTGVGYETETQAVVYIMDDENSGPLTITTPGTYTMTFPAGTFGDRTFYSSNGESGNLNPELTYTWTIAEPQPATFVPEVTPAAGDVTADEMKHTVITLPAAFAKWDNSIDTWYDQIYFNVERSSGTSQIWMNYASDYGFSEDNKTIDIVWDFSIEEGATYTLVIPAGNIVLEDGSTNERVELPYNIVEKKNDYAEFTVPAGYMGWLGYNETDANYWAPEFPFTVSTTANSTLVFTAELPSLPVGWVNMEVWDNDNNLLIATMTQTATATLADGEVYTVTGETTKEYVDGTTLNFRFRVPRAAGVSETITFQYVVGGGTITGADEIELDGNVAVRGNNIYAPEGAGIYTVSGIAVSGENLEPGVYVVVLGKQVVKVMVK